jgi:hypothetical protein
MDNVINIEPTLNAAQLDEFLAFCKDLHKRLKNTSMEERERILDQERRAIKRVHQGKKFHDRSDLYFVKSVVVDLLLQDWEIVIKRGQRRVQLELPDMSADTLDEGKAKTRRRHLFARNDQLREKSVSEFITNIERKRLSDKGWVSIFSVMREGGDLAEKLKYVASLATELEQIDALNSVIKPYIQFVEPNERCKETGMLLSDIWRYFRHTWANEYKSLPGRTISILIRDAAAPYHPVIGIAALGSAVAQQTRRDEWIGWEGKFVLERMKADPGAKYAKWIIDTLDNLMEDIYLKDFFLLKIVSLQEIRQPTPEIITKLRELSAEFRKEHVKKPHLSKFTTENDSLSWDQRAETNLFRSKRAVILAELLSIKMALNKHGFNRGTKRELEECLDKAEFRDAIFKLARKVKANHVGINLMDIIVCGAVAPYNHILGGKLVCMLLASPEVTHYYNERYSATTSLIASSMKGSAVIRKPQLVFLGTTSLYGVGSSQYNRIKIPCEEIGGDKGKKIEYKELGISEGFGLFHFSATTISLADAVTGRAGAKKVNSIFGEGSNPLLRKVKEAIEFLGLDSKPILNHRNPRVVYGVGLAENFGDILLGMAQRPKYLIPQTQARQKTMLIGQYWIRRWLLQRIMRTEILEQVARHTLSYPITHGARVPDVEDDNQMSLFE